MSEINGLQYQEEPKCIVKEKATGRYQKPIDQAYNSKQFKNNPIAIPEHVRLKQASDAGYLGGEDHKSKEEEEVENEFFTQTQQLYSSCVLHLLAGVYHSRLRKSWLFYRKLLDSENERKELYFSHRGWKAYHISEKSGALRLPDSITQLIDLAVGGGKSNELLCAIVKGMEPTHFQGSAGMFVKLMRLLDQIDRKLMAQPVIFPGYITGSFEEGKKTNMKIDDGQVNESLHFSLSDKNYVTYSPRKSDTGLSDIKSPHEHLPSALRMKYTELDLLNHSQLANKVPEKGRPHDWERDRQNGKNGRDSSLLGKSAGRDKASQERSQILQILYFSSSLKFRESLFNFIADADLQEYRHDDILADIGEKRLDQDISGFSNHSTASSDRSSIDKNFYSHGRHVRKDSYYRPDCVFLRNPLFMMRHKYPRAQSPVRSHTDRKSLNIPLIHVDTQQRGGINQRKQTSGTSHPAECAMDIKSAIRNMVDGVQESRMVLELGDKLAQQLDREPVPTETRGELLDQSGHSNPDMARSVPSDLSSLSSQQSAHDVESYRYAMGSVDYYFSEENSQSSSFESSYVSDQDPVTEGEEDCQQSRGTKQPQAESEMSETDEEVLAVDCDKVDCKVAKGGSKAACKPPPAGEVRDLAAASRDLSVSETSSDDEGTKIKLARPVQASSPGTSGIFYESGFDGFSLFGTGNGYTDTLNWHASSLSPALQMSPVTNSTAPMNSDDETLTRAMITGSVCLVDDDHGIHRAFHGATADSDERHTVAPYRRMYTEGASIANGHVSQLVPWCTPPTQTSHVEQIMTDAEQRYLPQHSLSTGTHEAVLMPPSSLTEAVTNSAPIYTRAGAVQRSIATTSFHHSEIYTHVYPPRVQLAPIMFHQASAVPPWATRNPRLDLQQANNLAMANLLTRRGTYHHGWPIASGQDPTMLALAGFYYTENESVVRCWWCGLELPNLSPGQDPWVEHARHSPDCQYLLEMRGRDSIARAQARPERKQ